MAELNDRIQKILEQFIPNHDETCYLLAVSGGVDSVAMVNIMVQLKLRFEVAHCNFQLRGREADLDEQLVSKLAKKLQVPFHIKQFDTKSYAKEHGISTQMAARELRYEWFEAVMKATSCEYLCTAHHLNDSIETSLFNLAKGTGLDGITGISMKRKEIFRPLLTITKKELLEYAKRHKLDWREDSTNNSTEYMRTIIRNETIPSLEKINPAFVETSALSLDRFAGSQGLLDRYLAQLLADNLSREGDAQVLALDFLDAFSLEERCVCLHTWLSGFGFNFAQVKDIAQHSNQSGNRFLSAESELVVDRRKLILSPKSLRSDSIELQGDVGKEEFELNGRNYLMYRIPAATWKIREDPKYLQMDMDKLQFPLLLRGWKQGDWFIPLGMKGKKKISDFMIDRKIPINFKREVLVLISAENIAGIVGHRVDERFKVDENTREVLVVKEI